MGSGHHGHHEHGQHPMGPGPMGSEGSMESGDDGHHPMGPGSMGSEGSMRNMEGSDSMGPMGCDSWFEGEMRMRGMEPALVACCPLPPMA